MTPKRMQHTGRRTARRTTSPTPRSRKPAATPPPDLEVAEQLANLITLTDRLADECRHLGQRIAAAERELSALRPGPAVPSDVVPGA